MSTALDALAAEHVMRWSVCPDVDCGGCDAAAYLTRAHGWWVAPPDECEREWSPSTRIVDAMDLVRALNEWREDYATRRGKEATKTEGLLELEQSGPRRWHARFLWLQPAHVCDEAGWGETPSLAITLAALRSVGADEDLIEAAENAEGE